MIIMFILCDWTIIWSGVSAVAAALSLFAAIAIYILAKRELAKNNEIAELDIYFRIKSDLNSLSAQRIYQGIINKNLTFERNADNSVCLTMRDGHIPERCEFAEFESQFLSHFEDLAIAHEKGLISLDTIKAGYSSVILNLGNSPTVYNYISYLRNEMYHDKDLYTGFEQLYLNIYNDLSPELKKKYRPVFL
jgi:hypothetical protein